MIRNRYNGISHSAQDTRQERNTNNKADEKARTASRINQHKWKANRNQASGANQLKKGKQKSPGRATSIRRSQPLTPVGREKVYVLRHDVKFNGSARTKVGLLPFTGVPYLWTHNPTTMQREKRLSQDREEIETSEEIEKDSSESSAEPPHPMFLPFAKA